MYQLIITILCVIASSLSAANEKAPSQQQVAELIKASGIELQITQIPQTLKQSAQSQGPASLFVQPLMQSLGKVFQPEEMLSILQKDLISRLDVPTMLDAMTWYNSSNGKQIIAAQKTIMQPQMLEKVGKALVNQNTNVSPERQALITKLAKSNQSVEIALDLMVTMQASFMSGLTNLVAPSQAQSFEQLSKNFAESKNLMRDQIGKQIITQQTVIYENLSDQTLKEFLAFSNSKSGQKLFHALNASLNHTLKTVAQRIPDAMQNAQAPATH